MVDQILDKRTVAIPGPIGTVTPQVQALHDETLSYRDEARTYSATMQTLQDGAMAAILSDAPSRAATALPEALLGRGGTALWCGDSYIEGYRATAPEHRIANVASAAIGWQVQNYADGGSGFTLGGKNHGWTFQNQIDNAHNAGVNPTVVVPGGGRNDGHVDETANRAWVEQARGYWPPARSVAVPRLREW